MENIIIPIKNENNKKLTVSEMLELFKPYIENNKLKDKIVMFEEDPIYNHNISIVLIRLAKYKIIPIIHTSLGQTASSFLFINSIINLFNECYRGVGEIRIFIKSTSEKERNKITKEIVSLTQLSTIFEKCPKLKKNKIILVLDPTKKQDIVKLVNLFSPDQFTIDFNNTPDQELLNEIKKYNFEIYKKENNNE